MKPLFLLLPLVLVGATPAPPAVRVTFAPLTRTAYLAALRHRINVRPRLTFPLRKQQGRLVVPTANGPRVLRDGWVDGEREPETCYRYLGYWPGLRWHWVEGYHYDEVYQLHVVTRRGQLLTLNGEPEFSPDTSQFIVASGALDGMGDPTIQLFRQRQGVWREVWHLLPETWQVEQVAWVAPNALLLQQKHWNKDFSHSWFTYTRLTLR